MRYFFVALLIAAPAFAQDVTGDLNTTTIGSNVDSNNVTYNGAGSSPGSMPASPVMSAVAPTVMGGGGNDSCLIPRSTGLQVTLFGVSRGDMVQDPECNRRKDARLIGTPQQVGGLGLQVSGISVLCQGNAQVFRAMALANTPCPIMDIATGRLLIGRDAFLRYRSAPEIYVVGYDQDRAFWDALLMIGQELPDVQQETGPRLSLSERFRSSTRADGGGAGDIRSDLVDSGD
ncbi:hypothetical protein [Yoonia sp.]|uniref:hypothetical protein n=1 Tax=Yoonia sp. TaxID=2212373 RepID=UPI002E01C927|nr:hypothetical protein [Yoonia sp.]